MAYYHICPHCGATLSRARKELGLKAVSIGRPPHRKAWWILPDVDEERFKIAHAPPPEQMHLKTPEINPP